MAKFNTILTAGAGLIINEASAEVVNSVANVVTQTPEQNIITIADLLVKIAVAVVTIWKLIKKPKPTVE